MLRFVCSICTSFWHRIKQVVVVHHFFGEIFFFLEIYFMMLDIHIPSIYLLPKIRRLPRLIYAHIFCSRNRVHHFILLDGNYSHGTSKVQLTMDNDVNITKIAHRFHLVNAFLGSKGMLDYEFIELNATENCKNSS